MPSSIVYRSTGRLLIPVDLKAVVQHAVCLDGNVVAAEIFADPDEFFAKRPSSQTSWPARDYWQTLRTSCTTHKTRKLHK